MFIGRDQKRLNIWTVSPTSPLDNSSTLFIDQQKLRQHCFYKDVKTPESNEEVSSFSGRKKTIFIFIFPLIFIGVFMAVYYIFYLHRNVILINLRQDNVNLRVMSKSEMFNQKILNTTLSDSCKGDRKMISGQFRISNKRYSDDLKNKTSNAFKKLSRLIHEQMKMLMNERKSVNNYGLNNLEVVSLRKGDNLEFNLNGIIVELVLTFNRDVCSLNQLVIHMIEGKRFLTGLEIDSRTIKLKFKNNTSDNNSNDNNHQKSVKDSYQGKRYFWTEWSDWRSSCNNDEGDCDEKKVRSRARVCWDRLTKRRSDEVNCVREYDEEHQSLIIEDCVCEEKCLGNEWKCLDSLCIPLTKRCDGHFNCFDDSDEKDCECSGAGMMHCGNKTSCISVDKKCDGFKDCWDGFDEVGCTIYNAQDYN